MLVIRLWSPTDILRPTHFRKHSSLPTAVSTLILENPELVHITSRSIRRSVHNLILCTRLYSWWKTETFGLRLSQTLSHNKREKKNAFLEYGDCRYSYLMHLTCFLGLTVSNSSSFWVHLPTVDTGISSMSSGRHGARYAHSSVQNKEKRLRDKHSVLSPLPKTYFQNLYFLSEKLLLPL